MLELVSPTTRLHGSWLDSYAEWGRGGYQHGAGLHPDDDVETPAGFSAWVDRLRNAAEAGIWAGGGRVPAHYWWVVRGGTYLGSITLRHELNDVLLREGGHIGYGIRPSARGQGIATWALQSVLPRAAALGLEKVLVTCKDDNPASAQVIIKAGGVLEDVRLTGLGLTRRYWITL